MASSRARPLGAGAAQARIVLVLSSMPYVPPHDLPAHVTRFALSVNGERRVVDAPAGGSLLDVLRDELGLFGAKYGCGEGRCGACCVLIDGHSTPACTVRLEDVGGRAIVTVEGLAKGGVLSPLQEAFVAEGAMQCGYCTSGMLIGATALLSRRTPPLADDEIRDALSGHLCRCGVYGRVLRAVQRAAGGSR
jgi:aerobic-type carbon monoxide dehydrogenase small subunit (CoxS/CutS family)